jgi:4-amino-4-deoxy-L-arabinose transferase-like glycosyltransferase
MNLQSSPGKASFLRLSYCLITLFFAIFVYFYGLGSQYIPKNGDENPYAHITRLTAASQHLLPLQSELDHMRNTKPPLLFWQGIASTAWGREWSLFNLRYPSVIYTILTAVLILLLTRKLSGDTETGVVAALAFLAFFNTYRYGRPFLTDPGLVFWLWLPFFILLYWRPFSFNSRMLVPLVVSITLGISLLYKSFALVAPACLALAWWYLHERDYRIKEFIVRDSWKIIINGALAFLIFGLWFLFDPDPAAIWQEFVVGENIGKFDPRISSYLKEFLWGSSSIWSLILNFLANAGLLIFPMTELFFLSFRERQRLTPEKRLLWFWIMTLFIVFSLPSVRSGRYLLPVMPALAVLLALDFEKISRRLFVATLLCGGLIVAFATFISLRLQIQLGDNTLYHWPYWLLLTISGGMILLGILQPLYTRRLSLLSPFFIYLIFSSFLSPFDGQLGNYSADVQHQTQGRQVWVPTNFRAQDERFRFLLPGADIHGYQLGQKLSTRQLSERYSLFAVQVPIVESTPAAVLADCPNCQIVGERLDIRSRHNGMELKSMFLGGKLFELLFVREFLIESPLAPRIAE